MSLKNVQRYTISLPKTVVRMLEINVPKNKRSKFIAEIIEKNFEKKEGTTYEEVSEYWDAMAELYKPKTRKSAAEMQREDRLTH